MRAWNPCRLARLRLFGWYVRFTISLVSSRLFVSACASPLRRTGFSSSSSSSGKPPTVEQGSLDHEAFGRHYDRRYDDARLRAPIAGTETHGRATGGMNANATEPEADRRRSSTTTARSRI